MTMLPLTHLLRSYAPCGEIALNAHADFRSLLILPFTILEHHAMSAAPWILLAALFISILLGLED